MVRNAERERLVHKLGSLARGDAALPELRDEAAKAKVVVDNGGVATRG